MASHQGRVFKRCGCRDENSGRALGVRCPKLRRQGGAFNPRHGDWGYQLELPRTIGGKRRQARRTGLESQEQAWEVLDHLKALLELAEGEGEVEVQIADLIQNALKARTWFPSVEEVRKRLGTGADVRKEAPTVGAYLTGWIQAKPDLAEGTRASYQGHIRKYLVPHLGKVRLDRLK